MTAIYSEWCALPVCFIFLLPGCRTPEGTALVPTAGRTVPELRACLKSGDWKERAGAAMGLTREGTNAAVAFGELAGLTSDPVPQVRRAAIEALASADSRAEEFRPILLERLGDDSWMVRAAAARALARQARPVPEAAPALAKCVRDMHWQVRQAAIEALAEMRYPAEEFIPILRRALSDSVWTVQAAAAEALGELGPAAQNAVPDLIRSGRNANWLLRETAARAVSRCEPSTPRPLATAVEEKVAEARSRMGKGVQTEVAEGVLVCVRAPDLDEPAWLRCVEVLRRSVGRQRFELYGTNRPPGAAAVLFCAGERDLAEAMAAWSSGPPHDSGCYDDAKGILFVRADEGDGQIRHEVSHLLMDADFGFLDGSWYTGGKGFTAWLNEGVAGFWEGALSGRFAVKKDGRETVVQVEDARHWTLLAALKRLRKYDGDADWRPEWLPAEIPPMTIDWMLSLSDQEFYRHYVGRGHLSMALAREFILYLHDKGKLREFYTVYRNEITTCPTRRRRMWNSERVARRALEGLLGAPMAAIDADFLKWTTTRCEPATRADGNHASQAAGARRPEH